MAKRLKATLSLQTDLSTKALAIKIIFKEKGLWFFRQERLFLVSGSNPISRAQQKSIIQLARFILEVLKIIKSMALGKYFLMEVKSLKESLGMEVSQGKGLILWTNNQCKVVFGLMDKS